MQKLLQIQSELKAPKNQINSFGNYNYRSCEDILEAVKPLLVQHECTLTITDDIVAVWDRVYVKATATINDGNESISVNAFARESETKKGMDDSQITGSASSYARKYALNGLFLIDDTKDADATNDHKKREESKLALQWDDKPRFNDEQFNKFKAWLLSGKIDAERYEEWKKIITSKYKLSKSMDAALLAFYKWE